MDLPQSIRLYVALELNEASFVQSKANSDSVGTVVQMALVVSTLIGQFKNRYNPTSSSNS
ncbi:hypothetical protein T02_14559 [Trichinella nativa]|uniref:Uncharacterized protein n=1 Tax=Trichinella nativa TaxID=6335 RepID=A0A0V1LEP8_9BILA|nr:hypothetical protein T02_14559 [Trichinella nativa]